MPDYSLIFFNAASRERARRWLLLGVLSLGIAGIFAGVLANSKSAYFDTALTIHVDLSVLVWFLTMACMFFCIASRGREPKILADVGFYVFAAGTFCLIASAFTGAPALKSNYIPVIHHPLFFLGLSLLLSGVLAVAVPLVWLDRASFPSAAEFGITSAAWIMLVSVGCFFWSASHLSPDLSGVTFYEYAFWGGGHVLQFVHSQLLVVAWLWLASVAGLRVKLRPAWAVGLYAIGLLAVLAAPFIYLSSDAATAAHSDAFTRLMRHANGLAPLAAGILVVAALGAGPDYDRLTDSVKLPLMTLCMSILLFTAGGALGYRIAGSNLIVPAHYHGSIVGITLAYMGVAYMLLPGFGYADVRKSRLALIQPVLYGGGQLCWMAGMAILGAHGVPRKTVGSADFYSSFAAFLKHGGDGLALIGGLLFVFVVAKSIVDADKRKVKTV